MIAGIAAYSSQVYEALRDDIKTNSKGIKANHTIIIEDRSKIQAGKHETDLLKFSIDTLKVQVDEHHDEIRGIQSQFNDHIFRERIGGPD